MPQNFWRWFENNLEILNRFEPGMDDVLDSISSALSEYNPNLAFEISEPINGIREFIISADGVAKEFPSVIELYEAKPDLSGWTITAFRPRMSLEYSIRFGPLDLNPDELWIYWRESEGYFDLIIYFPDFNEEDKNIFVNAAYILLDMAIGEYYVATGIRYIDHQLLPENPSGSGLTPFKSLPDLFFAYIKNKG